MENSEYPINSDSNSMMSVLTQINISLLKTKINLLFPVGGAIINEFLFDLYGRIKQDRINVFVEELAKRTNKLETDALNKDYFHTPEFLDLTQKIFETAANSNAEFKRRFLANIYLESILTCNANIDYYLIFSDFIKSMNANHISILKFIANNQSELIEIGSYQNYFDKFQSYSHNSVIDKYEFKYYNTDLEIKSLISSGAGLNNFDDTSSISAYSDHKETSVILTSMGEKFIKHLFD